MPNTIEQTKSVNLFAGMLTDNKVAITGLSNPQPVLELLYYKYDQKTAEALFGKTRFSNNVALCQVNVHNALNVFDNKKSLYSDIGIQYDIIVYKTDNYEQDNTVYISLYSKHGMAQFNAGIMSLPAAPIVVNTVCSTLPAVPDVILSTVEDHIKTLRLRLAESIKV